MLNKIDEGKIEKIETALFFFAVPSNANLNYLINKLNLINQYFFVIYIISTFVFILISRIDF